MITIDSAVSTRYSTGFRDSSDEAAPVWRKSSRCGPTGGNCVEVAAGPGRVAVRDSKDPSGPRLSFSPVAWRRFLAGVPR